MRFVTGLALAGCLLLAGCGGNGLPPAANVSVAVVSARTSIATGESVLMTATITGYKGDTVVNWLMQESYDRNKQTCSYKQGKEPSLPFSNCPEGYLTYEDVKTPMQSTFHAPPTAGTYHITFGVVLVPSLSETRSLSGTAAVVVQ